MRALACVLLAPGLMGFGGAREDVPSGTIAGRAFVARAVELRKLGLSSVKMAGKVQDQAQTYILGFKGTDEFMPDESIDVWFATEVGQKIEGMKLVCRSVKFGTDAYRAQHYKPGKASVARGVTGVFWNHSAKGQKSISDNVSDEISAVVQFGKSKNGWIAGAIALELPAKHGTRLRGSFYAKISSN